MELKEIIKSEFLTMLNESDTFNDNRLKFNQRMINSTFINYDSFSDTFDPQIEQSDIIITWSLSFWINESGIENMILGVNDLTGTFTVKLYNKQTDAVEQENVKDIKLIDWKYQIENGALQVGGSLYVKNVNFDFTNKIAIIGF